MSVVKTDNSNISKACSSSLAVSKLLYSLLGTTGWPPATSRFDVSFLHRFDLC